MFFVISLVLDLYSIFTQNKQKESLTLDGRLSKMQGLLVLLMVITFFQVLLFLWALSTA